MRPQPWSQRARASTEPPTASVPRRSRIQHSGVLRIAPHTVTLMRSGSGDLQRPSVPEDHPRRKTCPQNERRN